MTFSLSRWRPLHLGIAWVSYWAALVLVTLGPALLAGWRVARLPDNHGSINVSYGDAVLRLTIVDSGTTVIDSSVHVLTAALWVAVPPLVLWLMWLMARGRRADTRQGASSAARV